MSETTCDKPADTLFLRANAEGPYEVAYCVDCSIAWLESESPGALGGAEEVLTRPAEAGRSCDCFPQTVDDQLAALRAVTVKADEGGKLKPFDGVRAYLVARKDYYESIGAPFGSNFGGLLRWMLGEAEFRI